MMHTCEYEVKYQDFDGAAAWMECMQPATVQFDLDDEYSMYMRSQPGFDPEQVVEGYVTEGGETVEITAREQFEPKPWFFCPLHADVFRDEMAEDNTAGIVVLGEKALEVTS